MVLFGGMMCPWTGYEGMDVFTAVGIKIFLLVWIVFVPIVVTARLDKIIKVLQDKK